MYSLLFSMILLAAGLLPSGLSDRGLTSPPANISAQQPISPTFTTYLPQVMSRFQFIPGDYRDCRLGVGVTRNPLATYDITPFKTGWYVDWRARIVPGSESYSGVEYYQTLRVRQDRGPDGAYLSTYRIWPALNFGPGGLGPIVQANPGNVWLVGNEPDSTHGQDDTMPDMYARIYHAAYDFIKGIDPTAKVANAAVIMPTPLRLRYLDMVLASYRAQFGSPMPVDVWNMHFYIIREVKGEWGGDFPPGVDDPIGREYTLRDHVDINIFKSLVMDFRSWLNQNGYLNKPLIVTEWGVLMPLWFLSNEGVTQGDVENFLRDAAQFMDVTTNSILGYSADSYRLVQRNALYSLDDDGTFDDGFDRWGSYLMRSTSPYTMTTLGAFYRDQIAANRQPTIDLLPYRVSSPPDQLVSAGEPISPLIKISIANAGNSRPASWPSVRFYDVTDGQRVQIGPEVFAAPVTGCGTQTEVSFIWSGLTPGLHLLSVEVNLDGQIPEADLENNRRTFSVFVFRGSLYLPLVTR
jgi:hypothetical protein